MLKYPQRVYKTNWRYQYMAQLLDEKTREQVAEILNDMTNKVKFILFKNDSEYSEVTENLITELTEVNEKIQIESHSKDEDFEKYGLDKNLFPSMVLLDSEDKDLGIKFYGIPSGHEFSTLLQNIIMVSNSKVNFSEETQNKIKTIDKKIRIRAFVTPTCPYCPNAVLAAHQSAILNSNISGEMVEANEFPELSSKHGVSSVPHTVIEVFENDEWKTKNEFIGAYPEQNFLDEILKSVE
jgi:glutaredoxin-like protein